MTPVTTDVSTAPTTPSPPAVSDAALNEVVPLGMHRVLRMPGVTATLRRWRYRGQPRIEFILSGVPTDEAGAALRDQLLRLRAQVLRQFVCRGMHVFSTERAHDAQFPRMTLVDRLK